VAIRPAPRLAFRATTMPSSSEGWRSHHDCSTGCGRRSGHGITAGGPKRRTRTGFVDTSSFTASDTKDLAGPQIAAFLTSLATDRAVAASTQNQALSALTFLYRDVLRLEPGAIEHVPRAKSPVRVPVVLSGDEVQCVLAHLTGTPRLVASLLYGAGLRLQECLELRVKDVDFDRREITVRRGKGQRDRRVMLPEAIRDDLRRHLEGVRRIHHADLAAGDGRVTLPDALERKFPAAPTDQPDLSRSAVRTSLAVPPARDGHPARRDRRRASGRTDEARVLPHVSERVGIVPTF